jgi:hypothetical protein
MERNGSQQHRSGSRANSGHRRATARASTKLLQPLLMARALHQARALSRLIFGTAIGQDGVLQL